MRQKSMKSKIYFFKKILKKCNICNPKPAFCSFLWVLWDFFSYFMWTMLDMSKMWNFRIFVILNYRPNLRGKMPCSRTRKHASKREFGSNMLKITLLDIQECIQAFIAKSNFLTPPPKPPHAKPQCTHPNLTWSDQTLAGHNFQTIWDI